MLGPDPPANEEAYVFPEVLLLIVMLIVPMNLSLGGMKDTVQNSHSKTKVKQLGEGDKGGDGRDRKMREKRERR